MRSSTQESFTKFGACQPVGLETPDWRSGDAGECCTYHLPHTATPAALAATEPNSGTAWTHAWSVCPFGPPSFPAFPFRDFKTSSSSIPSPLFRSQSQLQMQNGNADSNSTSSSPNPRFPLLTALNPNARYNTLPSPSNGQFLRLTKWCNDLSGVWTIEDCPTRNMRWDERERESPPNPNVSHGKGRWSSFQVLTWQVRWQRSSHSSSRTNFSSKSTRVIGTTHMFSSVEAQYHPWFLDSVHELIDYANKQLEKDDGSLCTLILLFI